MFNKLREKTGKQFVKKYQSPFGPLWEETDPVYISQVTGQLMGHESFRRTKQETSAERLARIEAESEAMEEADNQAYLNSLDTSVNTIAETIEKGDAIAGSNPTNIAGAKAADRAVRAEKFKAGFGGTADGTIGSAIGNFKDGNWKTGLVDTAMAGIKAVDNLAMGDKNFGAQSEAIDSAVHAASSALMQSGNPYCVCAGTKIYTDSGYKNIEDLTTADKVLGYSDKKAELLNIEYLFEPHLKECVQIETEGGNILRCSLDHPVLVSREGRAKYVTVGKKKQRRIREFNFVDASTIKVGDHVAEIGSIPLFGEHHVKLAYLIGMLIGDGTYGKGKAPRLFTGDPDTWAYLEKNRLGALLERHTDERYSSEFRVYQFKGLQPIMHSYGLFGQTKKHKRLPNNIHAWDKESCAALLAGLFDTDGCVSVRGKDSRIIFYQSNLDLLHEVKQLLLKFGIHTYIAHFSAKDGYIKSRFVQSGECWGLVISRKDSVINFYNNITH